MHVDVSLPDMNSCPSSTGPTTSVSFTRSRCTTHFTSRSVTLTSKDCKRKGFR